MDLALNATTWDLDIRNGDLYFVKDVDCLQQFVAQKLKLWLIEWFLDQEAGFPFIDLVFVKNPNPGIIGGVYKDQIMTIDGVKELMTFTLDLNSQGRSLTVSFTIRSQSGPIDFSITTNAPGGGSST